MNTEPLIVNEEKKKDDQYEGFTYKNDAYKNANIFSKLIFFWALRIIRVNYK